MEEKRNPQEEQKVPVEEQRAEESGENPQAENSAEEYAFLQEVIKDEAGSRQKLKKDILRMIGMGFVFGIIACFTFCACRPWLEEQFNGNPSEITIPKEEEEEEPQQEDEASSQGQSLDTESYRQMLQSLGSVATETNKSVVAIAGITGEEDWTKDTASSGGSVSGVIVADNGQELLILGQTLSGKNIKNVQATFAGGASCEVTEKMRDRNLGLSIYAAARSEIKESTLQKLEIAVLGSSNMISMGDTAIVLGKPFGYSNAIGYGVISANDNYTDKADGRFKLICTDVVGAGAGSGIIANINGEVIGIIDQTLNDGNSANQIVGYGISDIKDVIERLSNGQSIPYAGIRGVDVTEELEAQGMPKGIYVKEVEVDSPAMAAGIQSGDIITNIDGAEIGTLAAYHGIIMKKNVGDQIVLKGCRQGAGDEYVEIEFTVTVDAKK